jgi:DinB family protein
MDARTSILERLRTQLDSLPVLVEGVPRENLDKRVGDKWSVTENVAHLARHTELTIERVRRILEERDPVFPPYRAEEDPDWPAWQARSFEESMEELRESRACLVATVERLTAEELERTGRHARFGPLPLRGWLDFYLVHEGHHLYTITKRARGLT